MPFVGGNGELETVVNGLVARLWFSGDTSTVDVIHPDQGLVVVVKAEGLQASQEGAGVTRAINERGIAASGLAMLV